MAGAKTVAGLACALWLAVANAALAQPSCGDWNTQAFFRLATAADVSRCLEAGADLEARGEEGATPLHLAAVLSETPAVVVALLDAGADPAARDAFGRIPWDFIGDDSPLKGSDAYRRLSEARFN